MAVILLYNGSEESLTYDGISQATGLKESELKRTLESLVESKLLVAKEEAYTVNKAFSK
jgi:DNA-binding IclR family transcriptional regulator